MRLVKAAFYIVRTPPPHWGGYFWYFVRLETDTGLVGWGETAIRFSMSGLEKSFARLVQDVFARDLDARDPMNREKLSKLMYAGLVRNTQDYFMAGLISAFDPAMYKTGREF